jgi:hypothetical protein
LPPKPSSTIIMRRRKNKRRNTKQAKNEEAKTEILASRGDGVLLATLGGLQPALPGRLAASLA